MDPTTEPEQPPQAAKSGPPSAWGKARTRLSRRSAYPAERSLYTPAFPGLSLHLVKEGGDAVSFTSQGGATTPPVSGNRSPLLSSSSMPSVLEQKDGDGTTAAAAAAAPSSSLSVSPSLPTSVSLPRQPLHHSACTGAISTSASAASPSPSSVLSTSPSTLSPSLSLGRLLVSPSAGYAAIQGRRPTMEDAHFLCENFERDFSSPLSSSLSFFGVYDGHAGVRAADMASESLHLYLTKSDALSQGRVLEAITESFQETDNEILEVANRENWKDGTTAVIALIIGNQLYAANVGDSEIILARRKQSGEGYTSRLLSHMHKAADPSEKARIQQMGGVVMGGRVYGDLAVSRALGDAAFKTPKADADYISCEPYTASVKLSPLTDELIILACDGLWDKVKYQEAVDLAMQCKNDKKSATEAADALLQLSFSRNSMDNITVIVVYLNWKEGVVMSRSPSVDTHSAAELLKVAPNSQLVQILYPTVLFPEAQGDPEYF